MLSRQGCLQTKHVLPTLFDLGPWTACSLTTHKTSQIKPVLQSRTFGSLGLCGNSFGYLLPRAAWQNRSKDDEYNVLNICAPSPLLVDAYRWFVHGLSDASRGHLATAPSARSGNSRKMVTAADCTWAI